jgi:O-antigen biosynthesis protein WbqP
MKVIVDIFLALLILILFFIPMIIIAILVAGTSKGSVLYWSRRVGKDNVIFRMPKFRTMSIDTPDVASHLLAEPESCLTPIGKFLRQTSLDELPQLFSVLKRDMSIVGPRPALYNQEDLIDLRRQKFIDQLLPGITGLAQVNGRDALSIEDKVELDEEYLKSKSFFLDIKILWLTLRKVFNRDDIYH